MLFVGGTSTGYSFLASAEVFDPVTMRFSRTGAMSPFMLVMLALLAIGLLASASWRNLVAGAIALLVGALVFRLRRPPPIP